MDSENIDSAATSPQSPVAGPGETLRAAREALRLDLAHVASETRIPQRHLEAIEAGAFETLPSRAYAIGFSRSFAKAVGLDPAVITEAVRAELADGSMRRSAPSPGMEPGDPARLPSAGLAWAAAAAVLVLMIGAYAFYDAYFGAGTEPGSLLSPEPAASTAPVAAGTAAVAAAGTSAPSASGPVVLTALEDGVWLRLYEEGGERLVERTLKEGEAVTVPPTAADPRINTGRPYALALTIGGQPVAKLAEDARTISGVPVSARALLARSAAAAPPTPPTPQSDPASASIPRPAQRRNGAPRPSPAPGQGPGTAPAATEGAAGPAPAQGAEAAPAG